MLSLQWLTGSMPNCIVRDHDRISILHLTDSHPTRHKLGAFGDIIKADRPLTRDTLNAP